MKLLNILNHQIKIKFDNPYNIFLDDKAFELGTLYDNNYKGSSTKKGNNHKVIPKCSNCERWGTMECPNSFYCYSTKTKPFFKPKQDE